MIKVVGKNKEETCAARKRQLFTTLSKQKTDFHCNAVVIFQSATRGIDHTISRYKSSRSCQYPASTPAEYVCVLGCEENWSVQTGFLPSMLTPRLNKKTCPTHRKTAVAKAFVVIPPKFTIYSICLFLLLTTKSIRFIPWAMSLVLLF